MTAAGVIEPSDSPWAAPAILVKKNNRTKQKDNSCVDYRRLNEVTRKDSYPLTRIDNVLDHISGSRWFSLLCLNPKKCQLIRREIAFLGHVVSADSVATDPAKIVAVRDWPPPTNVSDLRSFLGLASYYSRYMQDFVPQVRAGRHHRQAVPPPDQPRPAVRLGRPLCPGF
ncbi:hypothetical protein AAFF_G00165480 [Aldrovandia affinis]|uniref:Reverse transcriptase n=1 Tax=Aldrovandia affinis TaxID=143900 RepID=A0AAD7VXH8_9TELE|nr:hypothetical protein AAFF_G00165480 [Aldrovandia affinis]